MPLEAADLEQIKGLITEVIGPAVNNMFTARLGTFEEKIGKKLEKQLGESFGKTLDEKLQGFRPTGDPPDDRNPGGKGKKDVELESMRKMLSDMQTQLQTSEQARQVELEKNKSIQLETYVKERLEKLGQIQGIAGSLAISALRDRGRVAWGTDDDTFGPDKLVFRGDDGIVTDLDVGLKQWLKTEEAKIFQAPTGVRGSGSRPGGGDPRSGGKLTSDQQKIYLNDALERALE